MHAENLARVNGKTPICLRYDPNYPQQEYIDFLLIALAYLPKER